MNTITHPYVSISNSVISANGHTNYEILKELGKGANATVYNGIDIRNKREVAIKKARSGSNIIREIENHLLLNNLGFDSIPILYDYFVIENYTYTVQQLLYGNGLHALWKINKNWDFIWMTIYHALKVVQQFHNYGFYHGDLHLSNLIWTGDKMYLIDFDRIGNYEHELLELNKQESEINESLPEDWLDIFDYDPFEEIEKKKRKLNLMFCDDYSQILSRSQFGRLGIYQKFANTNKGYERFIMLINFSKTIPCNSEDPHNEYINRILLKYEEIDKLPSDSIKNQLS